MFTAVIIVLLAVYFYFNSRQLDERYSDGPTVRRASEIHDIASQEPEAETDGAEKMSIFQRLYLIAFFCLWLSSWTVSMVLVAGESAHIHQERGLTDAIFTKHTPWFAFAAVGWLYGALALRHLLRGDDL